MGTTANLGFPYPDGTSLVIAGDDDIQALADAVDAHLTPLWATGTRTAAAAWPNNTWTPVTYETQTASGFTGTGFNSFTYLGPSGRWFMVSFGCNYGSADVPAGTGLRLLHANAIQLTLTGADRTHLGGCIPLLLQYGDTLHLDALVSGNTGSGTGNQIQEAWLRVVSV